MSNPFANWKQVDIDKHNAKVKSDAAAFKKLENATAAMDLPKAIKPNKRKPSYTPGQVVEWCKQHGLPKPMFEYKFHPVRKWRMDVAIIDGFCAGLGYGTKKKVAIEVQGGLWIRGGHNRGAQMKSDWAKLHEAQKLGWKMIYCEPKDLLTPETAQLVKEMLNT